MCYCIRDALFTDYMVALCMYQVHTHVLIKNSLTCSVFRYEKKAANQSNTRVSWYYALKLLLVRHYSCVLQLCYSLPPPKIQTILNTEQQNARRFAL